jgi:glutathione synthase
MQRILAPKARAILVRRGAFTEEDTVSELGTYGTYVSAKRGGEVTNEYAGYLLRTKVATSNEGGVAAGFAVLNSTYLC